MSIAAASILAKEYRDEYLKELCKENQDVNRYGIATNRGYGTKIHMDAIKEYGITKYHRTSYGPCKNKCMF